MYTLDLQSRRSLWVSLTRYAHQPMMAFVRAIIRRASMARCARGSLGLLNHEGASPSAATSPSATAAAPPCATAAAVAAATGAAAPPCAAPRSPPRPSPAPSHRTASIPSCCGKASGEDHDSGERNGGVSQFSRNEIIQFDTDTVPETVQSARTSYYYKVSIKCVRLTDVAARWPNVKAPV